MSLNKAMNILDILIEHSNDLKKDRYVLLKNLLSNNHFYLLTSKEIANQTSLKPTFIRNFCRVLNAKANEDSPIKIYITKHGTVSLINTTKIGRQIPHSNSSYSENKRCSS